MSHTVSVCLRNDPEPVIVEVEEQDVEAIHTSLLDAVCFDRVAEVFDRHRMPHVFNGADVSCYWFEA